MKNEYNTQQKLLLTDYLKRHSGRQLSANDIFEGIKACGVGKSTVYRQIGHLCDEGLLKRFRGENGKSVLYQFVDADRHCNSHFHLKCKSCGVLIHLDCKKTDELRRHIEKEHRFTINMADTVLYGVCADCRKKGASL